MHDNLIFLCIRIDAYKGEIVCRFLAWDLHNQCIVQFKKDAMMAIARAVYKLQITQSSFQRATNI
jgi:hypothetical protein